MSRKLHPWESLDKQDYYTLFLSLLFAVYTHFVVDRIVVSLANPIPNETSLIFDIFVILVPLIVFAYTLIYLSKGKWLDATAGFSLGKIALPGYAIALITVALWATESGSIPESGFFRWTPFLVNIAAGELLLRALVTEVIFKAVDKTWKGMTVASILSGVLFAVAFSTQYPLTFWTILGSVAASLFYCGTRSILFLIIWDSSEIVDGANIEHVSNIANAIIGILIFFVIAVPANLICRSQRKRMHVRDGST